MWIEESVFEKYTLVDCLKAATGTLLQQSDVLSPNHGLLPLQLIFALDSVDSSTPCSFGPL
jgi:hypothetical protein